MRCRSNITFLMFLLFQLCGVVLKLVSNCYRPRSIILASCKPAFRLAWTCQKHVASRSKACRKPARTCRKPGHKPRFQPGLQLARIIKCGRSTRRDWCSKFATRFSTKKVESVSKACRKPHELVENLAANLVESQVCIQVWSWLE